jgi:aminoglycoside phosphotransferase family enzyme
MMKLLELCAAGERVESPINAVRDAVGDRAGAEVIETPLSWVILTERHAYKVKKAIDVGEAQLGSLIQRRHACIDEVWRNQRLAPGVYLGAVAVTREPDGTLRLGGKGAEVEWVVKMRRLRADRNMLTLIRRREFHATQAAELGLRLANFYLGRPPETDQLDAVCARLHHRINAGASHLIETLPADLEKDVRRLREVQSEFLNNERMSLNIRVCDGRVFDGHGDLRPEHIFFERQPLVIDGLECSAMLRKVDALDDLGKLAMECEHLGREDAASEFMSVYRRVNDDGHPRLEAFYKSLHACSQAACVASRVNRGGKPDSNSNNLYKATAYLDLARHYARVFE